MSFFVAIVSTIIQFRLFTMSDFRLYQRQMLAGRYDAPRRGLPLLGIERTPLGLRSAAELNRHGVQVHEPDGSDHDDQR